MTTEHKILALIDRGVRSEDVIAALLDDEPVADEVAQALYAVTVTEDASLTLHLSARGLDRLNALDKAAGSTSAESEPSQGPIGEDSCSGQFLRHVPACIDDTRCVLCGRP